MAVADTSPSGAVAIIGMGCRFPGGADDHRALWELLVGGVDAVGEYPPGRFDVDAVFDPDPSTPGTIYTRRGGFVERIDEFDAGFFGIAPREARRIDPQQRLLLEVAWEALEDGGQAVDALAGSQTGVYVGISGHDYEVAQALTQNRHLIDAHVNSGTAASIAANRISHAFDLRGPSLAVDTACSSSLTAVHLACRSLRSGESDLAIVGGVGALLAPEVTIGFCKASMLSPEGRCHAFDARANGYVRSEGAGAVVLKPLERAVEDGDPIHAVILGSSVNQDGRTTGLTVPSAQAQAAMIRSALRDAGVEAGDVRYVEAHGTGTAVGDPIEASAIGQALSADRGHDEACLIGSVKTNLGHLEAASGIAGLIKAALVVRHRRIPGNLHFAEPNPAIPFDELRLRVPTSLEPWPSDAPRAVAGVNSFGFGGANAHVLLEAPPESASHGNRVDEPRHGGDRSVHLLTLSARDPAALRELAARHARHLASDSAASLHDHCSTAAVRRSHHAERLAVVGATPGEVGEHLDAFVAGEPRAAIASGSARTGTDASVAFVFPGMGPQWWGMGRRLLEHEPVFRERLEEIDGLLRPLAGWSLLDALTADEASSRVGEAWLAHVSNFAVQVATAALWRSWGVAPDAVVGHSSGEMAAACVAGALSLPDAVRLAFHRGRLQHRATGSGRMLAAAITPEEAERAVAGHEDAVALAAINGPRSVTLAGAADVLERIERTLAGEDRFVRFLPVDVPYHGPQMDPLRGEFLEALADLAPGEATIPLVQGVTGDWVDGRTLDAASWWRNVREPVRFGPAVDRLLEAGHSCFVEVGPHPVLAASIAEVAAERGAAATVLPSMRRSEDDRRVMLQSLGALHARGVSVDWGGVYPTGRCVSLPAYPWQRERHWFDSGEEEAVANRTSVGIDTGHPLLGRRLPAPRPTFETTLGDARTAYLDAHVVQGSTVFPGAAYVEMMLAAAHEVHGETPVSVERVEFTKLLFLHRPRRRPVQLHYDPGGGSAEIHGGPDGDVSSWSLHAKGTLRTSRGAHDAGRPDLQALRARCTTPMPADDHYAMLGRRAYDFGPPFRTLQEIWLGPDEALARVAFPAGVDLDVDEYRVHPAVLDAALQLFGTLHVHSDAAPSDDAPFFPVSIERLVHRRNPGRRVWAHVTVRHADDPRRWSGDAVLLDEAGDVCIAFEGLRLAVLDEDRWNASPRDDDALYELRWEEEPLGAPTTRSPYPWRPTAEVRADLEATAAAPEHVPAVAGYLERAEPELNRIAAGFAAAAIDALGSSAEHDATSGSDAAPRVAPDHRRLLRALTRLRAMPRAGERDEAALHRALDDLAAEHPQVAAEVELVRRGGRRLAEILRGDLDAREVLLEGTSMDLLSRFYRSSPPSREYHELLGRVVDAALGAAGAERPLRVLEVGAGTGSATAAVLPHLPDSAEYVFTDVSPYFGAKARERLADHPNVRFEVLDLEADPTGQGFDAEAFDLVIGDNVLHTTQDLRSSLDHVRRLLAPGGMLVLLELNRKSDWFNLVFGLLPGWWRFADADLRQDSPLLTPGEWRSLLAACGFEGGTTLFEGEPDEDDRLQTLILARAPTPERHERSAGRHWLVFADEVGTAERLAATLRTRGDRTTLAYAGETYRRRDDGHVELPLADVDATARLLEEAGGGDHLHGIVHCWSLNVPPADALDTAALMDAQRYGCGSALALVQALERSAPSVRDVWLVTSGAQAIDAGDGVPNVSQSALWGLGRVLLSEHARIRCRLVDLGPEPDRVEIEALAAEMHADGDDEELALRGSARLTRRLERASLDGRERRSRFEIRSPETDAFRLEIDRPGALDGLRLRETQPPTPGPGELLIRVVASGLNFRDVLQALGMLPPAAFQHDPDPDAFGIECSGIVLACGEGTEGFRPGDEVSTLAAAAHGSRAVARADLTVAKPANLTFEDAASILNAFVTVAYALGHVARVEPGERVLVHSATGAVGLAAIQHCRRVGAEVLATAGTPEKRAYLRSLGIEAVMDSRSLAWADEVLEHTLGEGVDVVLNSLAGEAIAKGIGVLRPYGRFVELGKRDIYDDARLGLLPFRRNLSFHAVDLIQLALDRPRQANALIRQVARELEEGSLTPVPSTTFDLADAEHAFRLMAQAKHVGKVVLTMRGERYRVDVRDDGALCVSDATYLITGGLGGFGLAVAEWLVHEQGARTVVLMSRSGRPNEADADAFDALLASPADVIVEAGDVSREDDVRRVLARIGRELPPLRGVVHAAMVLDDDALVELDQRRFRAVLEPKVAGAWNLHRLTRDAPLDLFVMFSSLASIVGHPMQGNYSAANAFLDALASHRRALGQPAHTISWGVVSDVGYVSRHPGIAQHLDRAGYVPATPAEALATLGRLLRHDVPHVVAARVEWQRWAKLNALAAASRRFARFVRSGEALEAHSADDDAPLARVRGAPAEERHASMEAYLVGAIAKVLGTSPERVDPERPLTELGFDSLMAVELTTGLATDLGVRVQVVKILEGTSTRGLASTLLEALDLDAATAPAVAGGDGAVASTAADGEAADEADVSAGAAGTDATPRPLSFEQRRFWFLEQLEPGNPAYHLFASARLTGDLDVAALRRGLDELTRRHETLRTRFEAVDGEPLQVVEPPLTTPLVVHDVAPLADDGREDAMRRIATAEIRRPFDLTRPPLLRGALVRLGEAEHALVLIVHHIAAETWVMTRLVRELMALYGDLANGRPATLPEPAARYAEYVRRQAAALDEARMRPLREYWVRRLDGVPSELPLPTDRPRPATAGADGRRRTFSLSAERSDALRDLARRSGTTLFTTLLAAFQTLLHRSSGATDIVIGAPVVTRDHPGLEEVVGPCMNTVVLRTDLSGDPTFLDLLGRARETVLGALEHQDLPFERVVEALRPERDGGRSPLFRATLVMHDARFPELRMHGLAVESVAVDAEAPIADLSLLVDDREQLHFALEYDAELFDASTVARLEYHLLMLLDAATADPGRPLSELPMQSDEERRRVTTEWNDTAAEPAPRERVHDAFAEWAERAPDAVAVVDDGRCVSYGEVRDRANRLARRLQAAGVGPGAVVGVLLERSLDAVIAALAAVGAGGAYLPLDPRHPPARLRAIVDDARPRVLITRAQRAHEPALVGAEVIDLDAEVIDLDAEQGAIDRLDPRPLDTPSGPDDPAYVIYTSGSSGTPKGVAIMHRALSNQVRWRQRTFGMSDADRVLVHMPLGFDPSVWEIFGPLSVGACLIVHRTADAPDGAQLLRAIADDGVSVVQVVPSLLDALLEEPGIERCTSLRHVICGGEVLAPDLRDRFFARVQAELHNLYGPTETTIDATHWRCRRDDRGAQVPIGRPIDNVRVYVVDDRLRPVPLGVPGELCVGGAGVAPGYLRRPDETAARFVPDPFVDVDGARLYRTGDRARWREDGALEFLGRIDAQLKVRGVRIEPGDVEATLLRHPEVRGAAVVATGAGARDARLVAFVEAESTGLDADALGDFARERLPAQLVPSAFVTIDALPRTASGKVDRRALAARSPAPPDRERGGIAPRDEVEERLVHIWEELFPGQAVGIHDDFFDLGGHSLLAMRLAARIRAEFDRDVEVASVLRGRTVAALARRLRERRAPESPLVALHSGGTGRPFFCVHPIGGDAFPYLALARALDAGRPFYALEARGLDASVPPPSRIEAMAARYVDAVRSVQPEGPYLLGGWSMGGVVAFEMARVLEAGDEEVALLALLDAGRSLADPASAETLETDRALLHAVGRDLGNGHADAIAANLEALRAYTPRSFPGRAILIDAADSVGPEATRATPWDALALGGVERVVVPGDHVSMLREPAVRALARTLAERIEAAEASVAA